ncbi:choline/glycine/proline betaine transport protein [Prauserella aidingensis]|uniref:BCCT family transporter n=1 Tax=Prauserella aidingensis TaxID=387890 RepID=UPI0020A50BEC|nr:BCCT family transporter [Prauserella aidingensis]MCP2252954.1 choline/glycine/proline betaine transport protein [Prauserella aidingensis]
MTESHEGDGVAAETADPPDSAHEEQHSEREHTDESVDEQLRRHGVRIGRGGITPAVFWPALLVVAGVSLIAIVFPGPTGEVLRSVQSGVVSGAAWFYSVAIAGFIVFAVWMGAGRFGTITLGKEDEPPEFGLMSWFAMLFAAGMGIGLVFYGVGEPLAFATSDPKPGTEGSGTELAQLGMAQTFLHWGFHPWAVYAVIGLALAYAIHRRGRPVSIRWALEPLLGDRVKGRIGDLIDVLAVIGTVFGVATSLGLGVQQIATGLSTMGVLSEASDAALVVLIAVVTLLALISVVSGLSRGIRWLSNINLTLGAVLLISVLLLGPTLFLLRDLVESFGVYLTNVLGMSFDAATYTGDAGREWQGTWTIFYWGWWISWAPFVGVFIARISRGRTIREFVAGVLLVPTVVVIVWFAVLGGTGIHRQLLGAGDLWSPGEELVAEESLFTVLGGLPLGTVLSVIALLLLAVFFVTSSDSGSLVVDMLASGGHPDPPVWSRVLWAVLEGLVAIGLLLAGGLEALQAGAIATALPFSIVLILMCVATYRALHREHRKLMAAERRMRRRRLADELEQNFEEYFGEEVDKRIDYALSRTAGIRNRGAERTPIRTLSRLRRRRDRAEGATGPDDHAEPHREPDRAPREQHGRPDRQEEP